MRRRAGSSFRGSQKVVTNGGVERKLSLGLVRSFSELLTRSTSARLSRSLGVFASLWVANPRKGRLLVRRLFPSLYRPRKASPPL